MFFHFVVAGSWMVLQQQRRVYRRVCVYTQYSVLMVALPCRLFSVYLFSVVRRWLSNDISTLTHTPLLWLLLLLLHAGWTRCSPSFSSCSAAMFLPLIVSQGGGMDMFGGGDEGKRPM